MKTIQRISAAILAIAFLAGCEKDENQILFQGGTPPELSASTAAPDLKPEPTFDADPVMTFRWTNPDYSFSTGISSHDVNYRIEFDTVGSNFANPKKGVVVVAKELSKTFTTGEMNALLSGLNQMALTPDRFYNMEARVISYLGTSAVELTSNVVPFRVKPFSPPPVVPVPDAGTLWATGDAFASGWSNPLPAPYDQSQKFTRVTNTLYELTVDMPGNGGYKLIQQPGVWGTQYKMITGGGWDGGNFEKRDADPAFPGPPAAGKYKITFNFQTGKYTVAKQ